MHAERKKRREKNDGKVLSCRKGRVAEERKKNDVNNVGCKCESYF